MQPKKVSTSSNLLKVISEKARLEEGEEAVRDILREVFRSQKIGTKELAYLTHLPVPVTAAVRKELENQELLARKEGAFLTKKGERFAEAIGFRYQQRATCSTCRGRRIEISDRDKALAEKLRDYCKARPKPLPWLDQTHGTHETALLRALFMLEKGDVEGRRIIFLGDDDFTSIAVGMFKAAKEITVVDVDARLLRSIRRISKKENLHINCVEWDLRNPLPPHLCRKYDVAFADPPYTIAGLTLFISRGITALKQRKGLAVYLAFAHQSPRKLLILQRTLNAMGLVITEQIPNFNTYIGAEMFANTTFLAHLKTTSRAKPLVVEALDAHEKLYTGQVVPTIRTYQCRCGRQFDVGEDMRIRTVENLKEKGCPDCGSTKGFVLKRKQKLRDTLVTNLKLQKFKWSHFPEILEFEREIAINSFPEAPIVDEKYHRQKLEQAMKRDPSSLKVAFLNGEIVGWLWMKTEKDRNTKEKFGYIKSINVKPQHRRQGFGKKLMEVAENHFLNRGIQRIDLIVSGANFGASFFFEEVGFERKHSTMRKQGNKKS
ncbi:MAG: GNAT family N-acetyltransferase [Candidatus Bathyarchaeota archaeon]|nr:MAG: GNAT family N-acetyltransferase [Candidatus Bathyarchaeota archaeon]